MDAVARQRLCGVGLLAAVMGLPLVGAIMGGRDLSRVFMFPPPLDIPDDYPRFSWLATSLVAGTILLFFVHWVRGGARIQPKPLPPPAHGPSVRDRRVARAVAAASVAWIAAWWILAWTRFPWFAGAQHYTFFPLWLGFIVAVNALTEARTGNAMLWHAPGRWLGLFALSAVFWWVFEWLNRFVRNWHYLAVEDFGPLSYAVHATLCFSTVLPAVAAVAGWLGSHPGWLRRAAAGPRWRWLERPAGGGTLCLLGAMALLLTGMYPEISYPALWLAPLALLLGASARIGSAGVGSEMAQGNWGRAATWMIAALLCGFFWELWNWHSLAKWIYTVPGVERWHIFEMPLLGYAGYLSFGLECLVVIEWAGIPRVPSAKCQVPSNK